MLAYLEEVPRMVDGSDVFEVFTHLDYAIRYWPTADAGPFDPAPLRRLRSARPCEPSPTPDERWR